MALPRHFRDTSMAEFGFYFILLLLVSLLLSNRLRDSVSPVCKIFVINIAVTFEQIMPFFLLEILQNKIWIQSVKSNRLGIINDYAR